MISEVASEADFSDLGYHSLPKCCQNGAKWGPKSKPKRTLTRKRLNRLNASKHNECSMILGFGASGFRSKSDQKSMKKRSQCRSAFWHRCFIAFWSILAPFAKSTNTSIQKTIEKTTSKKRGPRGAKGRFWTADVERRTPSWPPGRYPPIWRVNPTDVYC